MATVIGHLEIDCAIPGSHSLKEKRRAVSSLKARIRARYNCSIAEVDWKDRWNRAQLAVCVVSDDSAHVDEQMSEIARFASNHHLVEVLDFRSAHL